MPEPRPLTPPFFLSCTGRYVQRNAVACAAAVAPYTLNRGPPSFSPEQGGTYGGIAVACAAALTSFTLNPPPFLCRAVRTEATQWPVLLPSRQST